MQQSKVELDRARNKPEEFVNESSGFMHTLLQQIGAQSALFAYQLSKDADVLSFHLRMAKHGYEIKHLPPSYALPKLSTIGTASGDIVYLAPPDGKFYFLQNTYSGQIKIMYQQLSPVGKAILGEPFFNMFSYPKVLEAYEISEQAAIDELTHAFIEKTQLHSNYIRNISRLSKALTAVAANQIAYSKEPLNETLRQTSIFGSAILGGIAAGNYSLGPCAATGPYAPLCVVSASIFGGIASSEIADIAFQGSRKLSEKISSIEFPNLNFISRANAMEYSDIVTDYQTNNNNQPVPTENYLSSIGRGICSGLRAVAEVISNPWDNLIYPTYQFMHDAQIIGANHMNATYSINSYDLVGCDYPMMQAAVTQQHDLFEAADTRMALRLEHVKAIWDVIAYGSGPKRSELLAQATTAYIVGGYAAGYALQGMKMIVNNPKTLITHTSPTYVDLQELMPRPSPQRLLQSVVRQGYGYEIVTLALKVDWPVITEHNLCFFNNTIKRAIRDIADIYTSSGKLIRVANRLVSTPPSGLYSRSLAERLFIATTNKGSRYNDFGKMAPQTPVNSNVEFQSSFSKTIGTLGLQQTISETHPTNILADAAAPSRSYLELASTNRPNEIVESKQLICCVTTFSDGARIGKCAIKNIETLHNAKQSFSAGVASTNLLHEGNIFETTEVSSAGLASNSLSLFQPIVSHTTNHMDNIRSILSKGIQLDSRQGNSYGNKAFYVAEGGLSIHEAIDGGKYTIAFSLSSKTKIYDARNEVSAGRKLAETLKRQGFDAIKYEGGYRFPQGGYSYNLAIINNPKNLSPLGVYPAIGDAHSAISLTTIRGLQFLGTGGTAYALYHAGREIINSSHPAVETTHQGGLFTSAVIGGAVGGTRAIIPCARVGTAYPPAALYTVPICIAAGSLLSSITATTMTEFAWQAGKETESIAPIKVENIETHELSCHIKTMNDGARIARCAIKNIESLHNARQSFFAGMASATSSVDLSRFSASSRPTITYTDMLSRQTALANGPFMFSSFSEPPRPSRTLFTLSSGREGSSRIYCDSTTGRCSSISSNSSDHCSDSRSSTCKSNLF